MACNSATCQSGCYREDQSVGEAVGKGCLEVRENGGGSNQASPRRGGTGGRGLCVKCKVSENMTATHSEVVGGNGEGGRFCTDCFRSNLFAKFRFAVTSNAMISPSDNVLVAFSGGSSSRVALQFVHEMQQKAQKNLDASRDRLLPVFGVGVAYIDDLTICPVASNVFDGAIAEMELIVSSFLLPKKQFFVVPIESVSSPSSDVGSQQLTELLGAVTDITGKEDLIDHLRVLSLQKFAFENGYTKIVMGTCTSRIASHVLEATVKGQGFSLAANIQYVDGRWNIPVVLPLRDCLSEELNMLCRLDGLKTIEVFRQPRAGINGLIASFVKLLKEENPSRESTIVRTAGKLIPFSFNRIPVASDEHGHLASQRRQKKYNLKQNESLPPDSYCFVCSSPLEKLVKTNSNGSNGELLANKIHGGACSSCQYQILPKDPSSLEKFVSLLPVENSHKLLRYQIQEFLLSDNDDDGT